MMSTRRTISAAPGSSQLPLIREGPRDQEMTVRDHGARYYATLTLTDNQYVAAVLTGSLQQGI